MSPRSEPEHLIVGAGLSGLYAALLLARAGRRVRLIERAPRPGGLAAAETFRGVPCDLGSHRLHPAALDLPLFREIHAHAPFLTRPRRGVLVLGGRHVPYPPSALAMVRALGLKASAAMGVGLLTQRRRRLAFSCWERERATALEETEDIGFERFVTDRVGSAAYALFYRPYAQKVWGLDPAELSQTVAKKRISTTNPLSLFRSLAGRAATLLDRATAGAPDPCPALSERHDRFIYPAGGTSSIIRFLEARLAELGVRVEYGRAFQDTAAALQAGPPTLFAGDITDLVHGAGLEHRGLYLLYLALPCPRLGPIETYYSPDPRFWFGRVSELQNYSPSLHRPGETLLCVEIPEGAWGRGLDFASGARLHQLLDQLVEAAILPRGTPLLDIHQRFIPNVYPLYRRGWLPEWRRTMRLAAARGALPFGRQALFLHCNLDHCAAIAAHAVEHVTAGRPPETWVKQAERYLELRVRD